MNRTKRRRTNLADVAAATAAAASNDLQEEESSPPPYLKLIADCWEHIFDNLSFEDVLKMGQTCKRMSQMAGYYIREYYPELKFELIEREIYCQNVRLQSDFYPYIVRLAIWPSSKLEFFSSVKTFDALKTATFSCRTLTKSQIASMENVLKNVEHIELHRCQITGNIFEQFANYCPRLKHLNVHNREENTELFSQHYPMLERLQYRPSKYRQIVELKMFLERHTKLKQFEIDCHFLCKNQIILNKTNIQLDLLKIHFGVLGILISFDQFMEFLKTLFERGCYKTLQILFDYIDYIGRENVNNAISTLAPALHKLGIDGDSLLDLSPLVNLNELHIGIYKTNAILETFAKSLPKLEKLVLPQGIDINEILPFLRHSKRLKTIKIKWLENRGLNIVALNQERKTLENACQVSIYVKDDDYLPIKWQSNNLNLELDLIRIVRFECFDF